MSATKSLIDAAIIGQSAALLGHNMSVAGDMLSSRKKRSSSSDTKKLFRLGVTNVVGVSLLKAQSDIAGGL